jgi:hypothetical protein
MLELEVIINIIECFIDVNIASACLYFNQLMHNYESQHYLFIQRSLLQVSTSLCHPQGVQIFVPR